MDSTAESQLTIPVDAEHGGFRTLMFFIFIIAGLIGYIIAAAVFSQGSFSLLAVLGAIICAYLASTLAERFLLKRWKSGRVVEVNENGVHTTLKEQSQRQIDGDKLANVLLWRFEIQKRARVPRGWLMVACALEQDNEYLAVYTFMSREALAKLEKPDRFIALVSKKDAEKEKDLRLAGQQRRLHMAENIRWAEGAEMTPDDFEQFLSRIESQFTQWVF